jgi:TolB-like protein/predicted metal-dependent HD superfamily phosphohydrolase/Flp pilus assembly protein TadD
MPALIQGFEYDIFISYRHKDNKGDRWVTEFVNALRRELETTFKEDITIYFDTDPHDGLLETHNVDKSLEGKLKSLIFIPIVSQTYCDVKSFAWLHEFCAFNKMAKEDQFGRDIKLSNGNVASRILPVKIHDLDAQDNALFGNELGGALRSIEFIFKSPGVNRPLRPDDRREDNLNRLAYRDQVNKVANALKEITTAMRYPDRPFNQSSYPSAETDTTSTIEKSVVEVNENSIAVLPFVSLAQDTSQEYFADGITENILIQLASLRNLRVISRTSIMRYKKTTKSAPEIAAELGVKYILEGSAQAHGNKVRINVQLIDAEKDNHIWSKIFVESLDDIFAIQSNVADVVAEELHSSINPQQTEKLKEVPTKNREAYDLFLKGRHAFNLWGVEGYRTATEYYKQAIAKDPDFQEAYSYLASSYSARMSWNGDLSPAEAQKNIELYLNESWKRGPSDNDYLTKAFVEFFIAKNFTGSEKLLLKAAELNANNATVLYTHSYLLSMMGRFEEAMEYVNKAKRIDPLTVAYFNYQTICLYLMNRYEAALDNLNEALQLYPSVVRLYDFLARVYLTMGRYEDAIEAVNSGLRSSKIRPPSMVAYQAVAYAGLKNINRAKELLDELTKRSEAQEKGVNIYIVYVCHAMDDAASARHWLAKAKQTNDVDLIWWNVDPLLSGLREEFQSASPDYKGAEAHIISLLEKELPALQYHNMEHIKDVLNASLVIANTEQVPESEVKLLRVAALFHDSGFIHSPKNHEEKGAELAREILPIYGFNPEQIEIICNMILATRIPQSPSTPLEKILCDADLDYLGRDDFYEIGGRLLEELKAYGIVETEREWNLVQKTFLESHRFHTSYGKATRENAKKERLQEIITKLKTRS